jgi:ATP-dependent DNA ligase
MEAAPSETSRTDFGALLVGYYEDGDMRYAGKVGTGFDRATLARLGKRLRELEQDEPPSSTSTRCPAVLAGFGRSSWPR